MSLEQIESFVAVAEEGALGRAAKRLHLTQPPLTRRIQHLEDELGVVLFERHARGMRLTPAGHRFLPKAVEVLAAVQSAREAALRSRCAEPDPPRHLLNTDTTGDLVS